ncbi:RNA-binding protein 39 [Quillaja saponaria]|uniref:RNA-binding protein 39 n=1 Tax=Quillaja saponaria TaxID=32244 RepID=A0AAD7M1P7_QUISA|nr:RNA-binding protein 39 [Quillaja saponaria]
MDFDEYDYLEKTTNGGNGTLEDDKKDRSRSSKYKSNEKDNEIDRRSKRSRSGDELRDYDHQKERGSSRHRSRSRDGDKERDRHRSSREQRDKEKDRNRDREERNGRERDRDQEHDRDRDRDRKNRGTESERERDREKETERSRRSRSHSERHRSDIDERERGRSHDRDYRDRERSRDKENRDKERERELRDRDRESRRHKEKKEEAAEPEVDPERDQRTVFAYQISLKADEKDVYEFFSRAGKVRDVRLIMDRNSRRSKGVGYIEFFDVMSVPMAIALSGQPLLGQPVMVKPSEAEKNLVQSTAVATGSGIGPYSGGARRLYVGNLHFNMTEIDLRRVFEAFGQVELVQLPLDETGHCKGFGFVQFARLEDARNAQSLNGQLEIAGRTIKVSAITDQTGMQDVGGNTGDFDDDDSLSLNACSRAVLMQKLDRSGTASSITGSLGIPAANSTGLHVPAGPILGAAPVVSPLASVPALAALPGGGLQLPTAAAAATVPSIDTIGVPSECLLLKNMFDPNDEKEPGFDLDIKEDVQDECSKYGNLKHIYVDKNTAGFVYLRFENTQSALSAQRALHGRWFAGKMITAMFMVPQSYEAQFPDSR